MRPMGMVDTIRAITSADCRLASGVSLGPGLTTFERMRRSFRSVVHVGADCLYGLVEFLLATARYEDIGLLFDEKFCRGEPNPFCSAGDDGSLAFEFFSHCLSPLLLSYPLRRRVP